MHEHLLSESLGANWTSGNGTLSLEYYDRDPLLDRPQATSDLTRWGGSNFNTHSAIHQTFELARRRGPSPQPDSPQASKTYTIDGVV
jgi:hypothetical protein